MSRTYRDRGIKYSESDINYYLDCRFSYDQIDNMIWRMNTDHYNRWTCMNKSIRKVVVKQRRANDRMAIIALMNDNYAIPELSLYNTKDSDIWSYD